MAARALDDNLTTAQERAAAAESRLESLLAERSPAALDAAIQAASLYIDARRQASNPQERKRLDTKCKKLLSLAEALKGEREKEKTDGAAAASPPVTSPPAHASPPRAPVLSKPLTTKEETLLWKSSRINGNIFPPWRGPPTPDEFPEERFSDPSGLLHLSETQQAMLAEWKRPADIHGAAARLLPSEGQAMDLTQDVITDCSVVASICAAVRREERGFGNTITDKLYPQSSDGFPTMSTAGKYVVKLYFNGCFRKVVIDDLLPASQSTRALYVICRTQPSCFAYALIEKAYLKLMGGYDFPGSNSGTDLLVLTGWLPEHIFLQSDDIVFGALWRRMFKAWGYGDVLITLGTGRMTKHEEEELGLIGEHDYAVLDMKEIDGARMMLVKNPWTEGTVWKGAPAFDDDSERDFDDPEPETFDTSNILQSLQPGVFWISLENVSRNFASIYLNWNPALFTRRIDTHFSWDLSTKRSETSFGNNPQFSLSNPSSSPATAWIHLSRHLGLPNAASDGMVRSGYISLYIFDSGGHRVYLSSPYLDRTQYVDSPQTLLRLDNLPGNTTYTLVVSSQDLSPAPHHFTLSVFSLSTVSLSPVKEQYPYSVSLNSAWTPATSGGNAHSPDYGKNPQFQLLLTNTSSVIILLETSSSHPIHVKLVHSNGKRIASVTTRDIIAQSGEYKRSTTLAEAKDLPKGEYTVLASTFETGLYGDFVLSLLSTTPGATLRELPSEEAGRFQTVRTGRWEDTQRRVYWRLEVDRLTRAFVKARTTRGRGFTLRIAVGGESGWGGEEETVLGEGGFSDAPQGVRTPDVDLAAGLGYVVALERVGQGDGEWEVVIVSDGEVAAGVAVEE